MASQETWQSPIAPGLSWYQATVGERPTYAALDGSRTCDVAIVGGGYTGLQAAYNLAKAGVSVVLIEACRFGDGASGRNGGQLGTGQRWWPEELEEKIGYERSKALFDLAEAAKRHLIDFAREHQIEIDYVPGQLNVAHKASYKRDYYENAEIAALRYGYPYLSFMDEEETQERLGSKRFHCGVRDVGTGHIHPLKLLVGLARVAANAGAEIFEMTKATAIRQSGGKVTIETERGTITAERALIACNGHIGDLEPVTASHVMPIRSFIGATAPLDGHPDVLPGGEAVADLRFVVRYFRKFGDGRLLFGGREAYTSDNPRTFLCTSAGRLPRSTRTSRTSRSPMPGAATSVSPCRASSSCARSCPVSSRSAVIPAMASCCQTTVASSTRKRCLENLAISTSSHRLIFQPFPVVRACGRRCFSSPCRGLRFATSFSPIADFIFRKFALKPVPERFIALHTGFFKSIRLKEPSTKPD